MRQVARLARFRSQEQPRSWCIWFMTCVQSGECAVIPITTSTAPTIEPTKIYGFFFCLLGFAHTRTRSRRSCACLLPFAAFVPFPFSICFRCLHTFPPVRALACFRCSHTFPLVSLSNWLAHTRAAIFCYCGEFVV